MSAPKCRAGWPCSSIGPGVRNTWNATFHRAHACMHAEFFIFSLPRWPFAGDLDFFLYSAALLSWTKLSLWKSSCFPFFSELDRHLFLFSHPSRPLFRQRATTTLISSSLPPCLNTPLSIAFSIYGLSAEGSKATFLAASRIFLAI